MYGAELSVLIVDDVERWLFVASGILHEMASIRIVGEATDGLEAIRNAKRLQPDLIVLDIGLPILNGITVAREIAKISPGSKIVFLTENHDGEIVEEAFQAGARAYVIKSAARSELIPAVQAVLEGKQFLSLKLASSRPEPAVPNNAPVFKTVAD